MLFVLVGVEGPASALFVNDIWMCDMDVVYGKKSKIENKLEKIGNFLAVFCWCNNAYAELHHQCHKSLVFEWLPLVTFMKIPSWNMDQV